MAHVAQAQLLRALICAVTLAGVSPALAQRVQTEDAAPVPFAPGATGMIRAPVDRLVRDAEQRGEALADSLTIQEPQKDVTIDNLDAMRQQALEDPRVRKLLGLTEEEDAQEGQGEKYAETQAILFASFSIPAPALRQMMQEATRYGVTLVFRGFVNNSVFDTRARLEEVFEKDELGEAFAIDPTLFRRFDIRAVPALVVLKDRIDACDTPACAGDAVPVHDRLNGNIPLDTALKLIAAGHGDASAVASAIAARGDPK